MKIFSAAKLTCLFALTSQMIFAGNSEGKMHSLKSSDKLMLCKHSIAGSTGMVAKSHTKGNRYATSAFVNGLAYNVTSPGFNIGANLLSQDRNSGKKSGAIQLTSEGVQILKRGDYWVDFNVLLSFGNNFKTSEVIVKTSKDFDLNNPLNVSGVAVFDVNSNDSTYVASGSGILRNVEPGTKISLVIRNLDNTSSIYIVKDWEISIFEIKN